MKYLKFLFLLVITFIYISCSSENPITSQDLDKENRIEIISKEVKLNSTILDADYSLFKTGGFGWNSLSIGPTDYYYEFVVKVNPADVSKWTKGLTEITADVKNQGWTEELKNFRQENWRATSKPEFYKYEKNGNRKIIVAYSKEGIVYTQIVME